MSGNLNRQLSAQEFDAKLSLADFIVGDSDDPLVPPLAFTQWRQAGAWEATLYEPELLATADARTTINYEGKPRSVINLCSYNYLGLPIILRCWLPRTRRSGPTEWGHVVRRCSQE